MKKNLKISMIFLVMVIVCLLFWIFRPDYLITKSKYALDSSYCESYSDCIMISSSSCGFCSGSGWVGNTYSPRVRVKHIKSFFSILGGGCSAFGNCYTPPSVLTCDVNVCTFHFMDEVCYRNCSNELKYYESNYQQDMHTCEVNCIK